MHAPLAALALLEIVFLHQATHLPILGLASTAKRSYERTAHDFDSGDRGWEALHR
jgi:hypothetical protein